MKKDPYFKYLVVIVFAGMIAALVDATPPAAAKPGKIPTAVVTGSHGAKAKG